MSARPYTDERLDRFSISRSAPKADRETARLDLRPPTLAYLCPSVRTAQIQFEPPGGRLPTNPSVCVHRGELWCVVRGVNYSMNDRQQWVIHDPHNVVRTENYLGRLRANGEFVGPRLMQDLDPTPRLRAIAVGYEDVRLVSIKGRLTGSATVCDRHPNNMRRIVRLHLTPKGDVKRADLQPTNQLHEKNWMPLSVDDKITWIYSLDPTAILPGPLRKCPFALDHLRGGAAMAFKDGYLCIVHEVLPIDGKRVYLHRFIRLDSRFNVVAVSPAWVFKHYGIEFGAGIAPGRPGQLVLSYGIHDREAWIAHIDMREIEKMKWMKP